MRRLASNPFTHRLGSRTSSCWHSGVFWFFVQSFLSTYRRQRKESIIAANVHTKRNFRTYFVYLAYADRNRQSFSSHNTYESTILQYYRGRKSNISNVSRAWLDNFANKSAFPQIWSFQYLNSRISRQKHHFYAATTTTTTRLTSNIQTFQMFCAAVSLAYSVTQ